VYGEGRLDKPTSSFETVQGVQCFLTTADVTSVDHPGLAFPDGARQFLVQTEVERAVGNKVRQHEHSWTGHGVDRGRGNLWGNDGDEGHSQEWVVAGGLRMKFRRMTSLC